MVMYTFASLVLVEILRAATNIPFGKERILCSKQTNNEYAMKTINNFPETTHKNNAFISHNFNLFW